MPYGSHIPAPVAATPRSSGGFTLIELMISMTISLLILAALVGLFVNISRSQKEMVKTNGLIENGRFAVQLLEGDLVHARFWGGYVPGFDDLTSAAIPGDAPDQIPNPCQEYSTWDSSYRSALLGIPVQSDDKLPTGAGCLTPFTQRAGTDVLVVRHADTCVPGVGNCEADAAGKLYFQTSYCAAEKSAGMAQTATGNSLTLQSTASAVNDAYVGLMIRTTGGTGRNQYRTVASYDGSTHVATMLTPWDIIPDGTTTYSFEYVLGTSAYPLHKIDCDGTGTPPTLPITGGTIADKRRFISDLYYIADVPHPERDGEVIPTLVRSQFDLVDGTLAQQAPLALIEGVETFRVELGIDNRSDTGALVNYADAVNWADPVLKTSPTNRGDGTPDEFIRCTTATPCTAAQLRDVVAVKLYVLARSRDTTVDYTDTKTYCLGEPNADGTCPTAATIAAANDHYKRHVFLTSVRLTNVSGRRETP